MTPHRGANHIRSYGEHYSAALWTLVESALECIADVSRDATCKADRARSVLTSGSGCDRAMRGPGNEERFTRGSMRWRRCFLLHFAQENQKPSSPRGHLCNLLLKLREQASLATGTTNVTAHKQTADKFKPLAPLPRPPLE